LELGLVSALGLPVLELAEVHDPANRGLSERGDLHEIELRCFRTLQSVRNRYDANLLTVLANQANLGGGDLAVDSLRTFLGYWALLLFMKDRPCFPPRSSRWPNLAARCRLGLETRDKGFQGHRPQILASAGTHGHLLRLHFLVAQDQLVRQLLQAMFSNFISYFLVAQIACDAKTGRSELCRNLLGIGRLAIG